MSSSTSSPRPRAQITPREPTLVANIYISTLQFIAALLLLLMLLWHISTVSLVKKYYMPEWCVADFMAELQKEWRTAVWVVVLTLVPIDCAHALLCLDWWCLLRYGRDDSFVPMGCGAAENSSERPGNLPSEEEGGLDEEKEAVHIRKHELDRSRITHDRTTDISTPSHLSTDSPPSSSGVGTPGPSPPYTYHPSSTAASQLEPNHTTQHLRLHHPHRPRGTHHILHPQLTMLLLPLRHGPCESRIRLPVRKYNEASHCETRLHQAER
jgi:hypothetical protein